MNAFVQTTQGGIDATPDSAEPAADLRQRSDCLQLRIVGLVD